MSAIRKNPLQQLRGMRLVLLAVVAGALFALPSSALATATPEIAPVAEGPVPLVSSGSLKLYSTLNGACEGGLSGSSEWKNTGTGTSRSGTMNLTLKGCKYEGTYCTTEGQTAGTVLAKSIKADLVWIDKAHTKAGVLLSPPTKIGPPPFYQEEILPFAEMSCGGYGFAKWTGSVIAQITSPKLNGEASEWTLAFERLGGTTPLYTRVEGEGPEHRLYHNGAPLAWEGQTKLAFGKLKKLQGS